MSLKIMKTAAFACLILALAAAGTAGDKPLLLRNGNILTVSGEPIMGGSILIRNGKIAAVRSVIAASSFAGSIMNVSRSESTKTGKA